MRVISASHKDLADQVRQELFRADLRFRLEVVRVSVPALREHLEDLEELAEFLLASAQQKYGIERRKLAPSAIQALQARAWPGNVREPRHVFANASLMALAYEISAEDVREHAESPEQPHGASRGARSLIFARLPFDQQKAALERALSDTAGHRGQAAKLLGISRASFYRHLSQLEAPKR